MKPMRGISLVELLIATTLLAVVTGGALSALSAAQRGRRDAALVQQVHERAQYVMATLEPEVQMAGYFAIDAPARALPVTDIPLAAQRCGADLVARLDIAIEVREAWNLPCTAGGGGAVAGTDLLLLRRVSVRPSPSREVGRAQWLASTDGSAGRLYWQADAPAGEHTDPGSEPLRDLVVRMFYVARRSDGDPSLPALRSRTLTSIAGTPAFIDTEVMNGIEDLQVELLPSPSAPHVARVQMRVLADAGRMQPVAATAPATITRDFALRNASSP